MSTLGVRSRAFPLWLARAGYVVAIVLLLIVTFFDWIILVFPAWIALVSLFVMRRQKARRLAQLPPEPARDVPA
jgi:Flp pilus assembly protein TadB